MDRTIYKYKLEITDEQIVEIPTQSEILTAQLQNDSIVLWAIVYPNNPLEKRVIEIYGTGHPFSGFGMSQRTYISTVQRNNLVWHIFGPI